VSSSQVKELMAQFNFEANKLELAKYCYRFATDKQYYYSVADGLAFSNSKKRIAAFYTAAEISFLVAILWKGLERGLRPFF
jgi:hypothetical protein